MKKFGFLVLSCLISTLVSAQFKHAGEYMDAISEQYKNIQKEMWEYTSAASHGKSARTVEKKRVSLIETTYRARGSVKQMKSWEGSTAYRDSVVSFLSIYYLVLKEDFAKIVDMEEIAERSYDAMEAYMLAKEQANQKLADASEMLAGEQKKFAEDNGIELVEADDDLTRKMQIADEVYDYYNEVYLIFFKSYIQEIYLKEAIGKKDVSAIEQNKSALSASSQEGLDKLKGLDPFKGDNTIIEACRDVLKFYQEEADKKVNDYTNYFLAEENFAAIKASFDQKKEKDRTQEDVDQYNKAVNDINASVNQYNATNDYLNKMREVKVGNWNKTVERFTDKHVPRG